MKKAIAILAVAGWAAVAAAQAPAPGRGAPAGAPPAQGRGRGTTPAAAGEIHVLKVRPNLYMLTGAGGNITVFTFDQGVVVVDTGAAPMADRVLEAIELVYEPAASSDGDSLVWLRHADVIVTGDIYTTTEYPMIDVARGGNVNGVIAALNVVLDLAFPDYRSEGGTMIVPGHGRLSDMADVGYYRDMVTIIRDRVQASIKKGMTLDQVKASKPTRDYDPRFGATTGAWTTDMFVEAVYKSLTAKVK